MRNFVLILFTGLLATAQTIDQLQKGFLNPPEDAKIMMRWWWFGPSLTNADIDRDLKKMKEGGIGGFEVQPVYPLSLDDPEHGFHNYPYLSDEFIKALKFTSGRARELGMRMDLTLCSGWPFGGAYVPVTQAAGRLRVDKIAVPAKATHIKAPDIGAGEKLIAYFIGDKQIANLDVALHQDQPQTVQAYISSRTGQQVKRAAIDAEGFVLDHYDRAAIDNHLKHNGDRIMQAFGSHPPRAVFSDSLEVFAADWTPDLLNQFRRRRGYDLLPYLPALAGDMGPDTGAIRNDWARTLTELANENYLAPIAEWAHKHGTLFRSQTYGSPPVSLSSGSIVDLPEGEQPYWRRFTPARWAASASHLYGKPVASTETWTWLHSPAFRATPLDMKAEADLHFLQGITQLVGHGWPSSPDIAGEPGWRFYAAAVFNHHNPWWIVMPDITRYLQRVSWILRQGKPAHDVALYLPTADARARFTTGRVSIDREFDAVMGHVVTEQILDAGYNFDFIDDEAIERVGIPYPILVLPNIERMDAAAARKIAEYKAKGGIVIATKRLPSKGPGLKDAAPEVQAGIVQETDLGSALNRALEPDFKSAPGVGFIHRKTADADIYFIANTTNKRVPLDTRFRVKNRQASFWDPYTGEKSSARSELAPYESSIVVLSDQPGSFFALVSPTSTTELIFSGGPWPEYFSGVRTYEAKLNRPVGKQFFLDFGEGTALPAPTRDRNGMRAMLEPPVREAAVVYVNGKKAGSIWHAPFELDVTPYLSAGENTIKLEVANTAINKMAGESLPSYRLLNLRYTERFTPQDLDNLQPLPSGLQGPVRLKVF